MKLDVAKRNLLVGGLLIGAVGMVATAARAGTKSEFPISVGGVLIDPGTGVPIAGTEVSGQIGSVRATSDTTQYIGCYTTFTQVGGLGVAGCFARDTSGTTYVCTSTSTDFRAAVRSINPQSYISFSFINGTNTCAKLYVENTSNLRTSAP